MRCVAIDIDGMPPPENSGQWEDGYSRVLWPDDPASIEILRFVAREEELEAEVEAELRGQVEISEGAGRMHDKLSARIALLEAVIAPLLPLFRERYEAWERMSSADILDRSRAYFPMAATITLTAEFPTAALRALLDRNEQKEEE